MVAQEPHAGSLGDRVELAIERHADTEGGSPAASAHGRGGWCAT